MPHVTEDNHAIAALFVVRREANSREVYTLERAFARIPNVGETVVFNVSILEYDLKTFYGDDKQLYTTVVQVAHHDDEERPTVYCEPAKHPYPEWAP